jgi:hypothetical protein
MTAKRTSKKTDQDRLVAFLTRKGGTITRGELLTGTHWDSERLDAALEGSGVTEVRSMTGGRPRVELKLLEEPRPEPAAVVEPRPPAPVLAVERASFVPARDQNDGRRCPDCGAIVAVHGKGMLRCAMCKKTFSLTGHPRQKTGMRGGDPDEE